MQLRCYRCGWSFSLGKDEVAFALAALQEHGGHHYDARCPNCRTTNKVSLEQLKRFAPRAEPTSGPVPDAPSEADDQ